jgi:glycerol-3-phosphate dehydrogenase
VVLSRALLPGQSALLVPKTSDGRVLFAIPWHGRVLVGTTDTPIAGLPAEPRPLLEEIRFLLGHLASYFDKRPQPRDVLSTFAGLRPLLRGNRATNTAKLSREHVVLCSTSGLITVTGGKWTTYRRMAIDAVDQAALVGDLALRPAVTADFRLHGWTETAAGDDDPLSVYGSEASALLELLAEKPEWNEHLHPALPYRAGEVVWGARNEAARTAEDVLARRLRALFLDAKASIEAAPLVAALLAAELDRDRIWQDRQVALFTDLARGYLPPA